MGTKMITNARVFDPEFVPPDVEHRPAQISHLTDILQRAVEGTQSETALLYGPPGAGKTCLGQFSLDKLQEEYIDVNTHYVNCWEDYTRYKTLYRVLEGIDRAYDIHRQSTPRDELLDRLRDYDGPPYVVILDEVDQLEDKDVLYDLYRVPNLSVILITNREQDLFGTLDDRLHSRLQTSARIHFPSYSTDELVDILENRIRMGLRPNAIAEDVVTMIGNRAAGDARVAIRTLRQAAQLAKEHNRDCISEEMVEESLPEAKAEIQRQNIDRLNPDQELLHEIITEHGTISPGELYEEYEQKAEDPKSRRMVRNYLQKMERYDLIAATGHNRGRQYSVPS